MVLLSLQNYIITIPLWILLPTVFLSNNFIILSNQNWFINIILLPLFTSSITALIFEKFNIINSNIGNIENNNDSTNHGEIENKSVLSNTIWFWFGFFWLVCIGNFLFDYNPAMNNINSNINGNDQIVINICIVLINLRLWFTLGSNNNMGKYESNTSKISNSVHTFADDLIIFAKIFTPISIIIIFLDYLQDQSNLIILSKLIFTTILYHYRFLAVWLTSFFHKNLHSVEINKDKVFFENGKEINVHTNKLYFISITTFILLYLFSNISPILKLFHSHNHSYELHFPMIFIYIGCIALFALSINDILSNIDESNTDNSDDSDSNKLCLDFFFVNNFFILIIGIMTLILQFLSFNSNSFNTNTTILSFIAIIIISEFLSNYCIQSDTHNHKHIHEHIHTHNNTNTHSNYEKSMINDFEFQVILNEIINNKETKSIFSFLLLNSTFMFVQLLYSFRSKSLGLLSDSLHMALDCTSLLLGLVAKILSNKTANDKFPFGLNYLETLAGFTNGVLLMGIVCGIIVESIERFFNPITIQGTNELIVVSTLGLLVNLVGLFAFESSHNHANGNTHNHSHNHDHHQHSHENEHGHEDHHHDHKHSDHNNENGHEDDNMKGIFLHVLADTLGSVGVIISTILIKLTGWHFFDPLASMLIGLLIFASSMPLLKSTTRNLLLVLDNKKHNKVKNALNKISQTPGISGYTTPRFWPEKLDSVSHSHSHGGCTNHDHSSEDLNNDVNQDEINSTRKTLVGFIHVQYVEGENSTIIKKRVERIFEMEGIKAWIQVEPQNADCWCKCKNNAMVLQPVNKVF